MPLQELLFGKSAVILNRQKKVPPVIRQEHRDKNQSVFLISQPPAGDCATAFITQRHKAEYLHYYSIRIQQLNNKITGSILSLIKISPLHPLSCQSFILQND